MSEPIPEQDRYSKFNDLLNSMPLEEMHAKNAQEMKANKKDFEKMREALTRDQCSFCGNPLAHFSTHVPCFHWLLNTTKGFRKKHFPLLYQNKSFHQLEAYLRWIANCEAPAVNINDLVEEKSSSKVIEETIRYKNLEWSFSCSQGCFNGIPHSHNGKFPHYHFQMKVDGLVIINYNGFHIPFNEYDDFSFAVKAGKFDRLRAGHIEGIGMQGMFEHFSPEELLDSMRGTDDETKHGQFNLQTMIEADEGTTISGDEIADLMEESRRTGIPMAKLSKRLKNVRIVTHILPGPAVPEIAARKRNRGNRLTDH